MSPLQKELGLEEYQRLAHKWERRDAICLFCGAVVEQEGQFARDESGNVWAAHWPCSADAQEDASERLSA